MTSVNTRIGEIKNIEGFNVEVINIKNGKSVNGARNGVLGSYPLKKAAKGTITCTKWIADRFEKSYRSYTCQVLYGPKGNPPDSPAHGSTILDNVRKTY